MLGESRTVVEQQHGPAYIVQEDKIHFYTDRQWREMGKKRAKAYGYPLTVQEMHSTLWIEYDAQDRVANQMILLDGKIKIRYFGRYFPELQADLRATQREVEAFALGDYARALMLDARLSPEERASIAARVARYTGLSQDVVERSNLRILDSRFFKELLRDGRRTVGRLDSRFTGIDRDAAGESIEYDRSYANIMGPYTACLYDYLRGELNYESDLPYEIINGKVWPWSYKEHENQYVTVAESLRKAATLNPHLRVFVANGYYDLATPYFATEYTVNRLQLDETLKDHVAMRYYEAGHMMYIHLPSLAQLKADLAEFVRAADGIEG